VGGGIDRCPPRASEQRVAEKKENVGLTVLMEFRPLSESTAEAGSPKILKTNTTVKGIMTCLL
jgi:hypothetical protein